MFETNINVSPHLLNSFKFTKHQKSHFNLLPKFCLLPCTPKIAKIGAAAIGTLASLGAGFYYYYRPIQKPSLESISKPEELPNRTKEVTVLDSNKGVFIGVGLGLLLFSGIAIKWICSTTRKDKSLAKHLSSPEITTIIRTPLSSLEEDVKPNESEMPEKKLETHPPSCNTFIDANNSNRSLKEDTQTELSELHSNHKTIPSFLQKYSQRQEEIRAIFPIQINKIVQLENLKLDCLMGKQLNFADEIEKISKLQDLEFTNSLQEAKEFIDEKKSPANLIQFTYDETTKHLNAVIDELKNDFDKHFNHIDFKNKFTAQFQEIVARNSSYVTKDANEQLNFIINNVVNFYNAIKPLEQLIKFEILSKKRIKIINTCDPNLVGLDEIKKLFESFNDFIMEIFTKIVSDSNTTLQSEREKIHAKSSKFEEALRNVFVHNNKIDTILKHFNYLVFIPILNSFMTYQNISFSYVKSQISLVESLIAQEMRSPKHSSPKSSEDRFIEILDNFAKDLSLSQEIRFFILSHAHYLKFSLGITKAKEWFNEKQEEFNRLKTLKDWETFLGKLASEKVINDLNALRKTCADDAEESKKNGFSNPIETSEECERKFNNIRKILNDKFKQIGYVDLDEKKRKFVSISDDKERLEAALEDYLKIEAALEFDLIIGNELQERAQKLSADIQSLVNGMPRDTKDEIDIDNINIKQFEQLISVIDQFRSSISEISDFNGILKPLIENKPRQILKIKRLQAQQLELKQSDSLYVEDDFSDLTDNEKIIKFIKELSSSPSLSLVEQLEQTSAVFKNKETDLELIYKSIRNEIVKDLENEMDNLNPDLIQELKDFKIKDHESAKEFIQKVNELPMRNWLLEQREVLDSHD